MVTVALKKPAISLNVLYDAEIFIPSDLHYKSIEARRERQTYHRKMKAHEDIKPNLTQLISDEPQSFPYIGQNKTWSCLLPVCRSKRIFEFRSRI